MFQITQNFHHKQQLSQRRSVAENRSLQVSVERFCFTKMQICCFYKTKGSSNTCITSYTAFHPKLLESTTEVYK